MHRAIPCLALSFVLLLPFSAAAQDEAPKRTWTDEAELALVLTTGNTETLSLGLKNTLKGEWDRSSFRLKLSALRSEDTDRSRLALGTADDFRVETTKDTNLTAEAYELATRYERRFGERNSWFAEAGWQRNEFAGVRNRYRLLSGLKTQWKDADRVRFSTDVGLSWTKQDDVVEDPARDDSWMGFRFGWELWARVGKNGEYGNDLILDLNLNETDDLRLDMTNWFAVSFTERLALKLTHQLLYDNQPSLEQIDLFDPADPTTPIGKVPVELDSTDTIFQASLVVRF